MIKLENLRPGENIEFLIRRHRVVFIVLSFYFLGGVFISSVIFGLFGFKFWTSMIILIFWMFFSIFLYIERLNHELDMFVITNNRIIFIEQKSFLNRAKTECNLGQIQEVNSSTAGLFANILGYGVLSIVTAGSTENLEMNLVPTPLIEARKILNIADKYRDRHSYRQEEEKEED